MRVFTVEWFFNKWAVFDTTFKKEDCPPLLAQYRWRYQAWRNANERAKACEGRAQLIIRKDYYVDRDFG